MDPQAVYDPILGQGKTEMSIYQKGNLPNTNIIDKKNFRKIDEDIFRFLSEQEDRLDAVLNGGLGFSENFDAVIVSFTSSGTPNAENTVAHSLGKAPTGFIVLNKNKAAHVFDGGTTWTADNIYLKVDVATTVVKILVF